MFDTLWDRFSRTFAIILIFFERCRTIKQSTFLIQHCVMFDRYAHFLKCPIIFSASFESFHYPRPIQKKVSDKIVHRLAWLEARPPNLGWSTHGERPGDPRTPFRTACTIASQRCGLQNLANFEINFRQILEVDGPQPRTSPLKSAHSPCTDPRVLDTRLLNSFTEASECPVRFWFSRSRPREVLWSLFKQKGSSLSMLVKDTTG